MAAATLGIGQTKDSTPPSGALVVPQQNQRIQTISHLIMNVLQHAESKPEKSWIKERDLREELDRPEYQEIVKQVSNAIEDVELRGRVLSCYTQLLKMLDKFTHIEEKPLRKPHKGDAYIADLKSKGTKEVGNTAIENAVWEIYSLVDKEFGIPKKETQSFEKIVKQLVRFELAKLGKEEIEQLETTINETFKMVKPLFSITLRALKDKVIHTVVDCLQGNADCCKDCGKCIETTLIGITAITGIAVTVAVSMLAYSYFS